MPDLLSVNEDSLSQLPLETLLSALQDADSETRAVAIFALGARSEPEAIASLIAVLSDPSPFLARTAADSLQRIGSRAVPALIESLRASDAQVRGLSARALAHIKDTTSIPALFNALNDESAIVQYWADEALERLGVGMVYFHP